MHVFTLTIRYLTLLTSRRFEPSATAPEAAPGPGGLSSSRSWAHNTHYEPHMHVSEDEFVILVTGTPQDP